MTLTSITIPTFSTARVERIVTQRLKARFCDIHCYATATIRMHTSVATSTQAYHYLGNCLDNGDRIVEFPQQRYMLAKAASKTKRTLGQGVLSLVREDLLKRVDFDSQEQSAQEIQVKFSQCGS
jgi:hypothetical protein